MSDTRFHLTKGDEIECYPTSDDAIGALKDVAKDIEEEATNEHHATCEHCQPALERGESIDCLGMDKASDASVILHMIAERDAEFTLKANSAFRSKIDGTEYSITVSSCDELCDHTVYFTD